MVMDYAILQTRFTEAWQWKMNWLAQWERLYLYVLPNRNALTELFDYRTDGTPLTEAIYDSTAMQAAYQRANDLHGLLLPKDRVWGRLNIHDNYMGQADLQTRIALEAENNKIFSYINQSNLARVVASSNLDLCAGTAAIYVESKSDEEPLSFTSIPGLNLFIESTFDDRVDTAWFLRRMNGIQFKRSFPKYRGKLLQQIEAAPAKAISVIYGQIKMADGKYFCYVTLKDDQLTPLFEMEKPYNPLMIYRDRVRPGEADGRGIAMDMLPTIQNLNTIVANYLKNMDFKGNPPVFYDADAYFNPYSVRKWSGSWFPRRSGSRNPVEAMEMPDFPEVLNVIMDYRNIIKTSFQVDPLGEINQPVKSATEISIRENRAQRTSATDISRLINELPAQVYEVATKILMERKIIKLGNKVSDYKGFKQYLKFDYQSPLYDLQKQQDLNNWTQKAQLVQQFFGEQAVLASSDLGATNDFLTDRLNLPSLLYVSKDQLMKALQNLQQAQQPAATPTTAAQSLPQMQAQGNAV